MKPKTFGRTIAEARIALNRSQRELATDLDMSGRELNDLERDRRMPTDAELEALAQHLHLERAVLRSRIRDTAPPRFVSRLPTIEDTLAVLKQRLASLCTEALKHDKFDRVAIIVWREDTPTSSSLVGNMASLDEIRAVLAAIEANETEPQAC